MEFHVSLFDFYAVDAEPTLTNDTPFIFIHYSFINAGNKPTEA